MATTVLKESKSLCAVETQTTKALVGEVVEAVSVKCYCCGLLEECTQAYIARVRERYQGRWICGLCAEAVKDESLRSEMDITIDEALKRHIKFCQQFRSSSPPNNPTEDLILAMKHLLLRTLDSPRKEGLTCRPLGRSQSCFSSMPGTHPEAHTE
ncbi:uncharacterized protein LOC129317203 [Prosopis cineraria]|uniref:uncharacterized protein LOC129317203 n=1 Tax=Prosopis cineraria TaxID=364024 RepID=UPI00240FA9C6|nr:uncharacterized protein LOC129317203 [Prosopis cineraria]